jgi:hypothetical protein
MNFKGLDIALNIYADKHGGAFPENNEIQGGSGSDALIGLGMLKKYPPNAFSSNNLPIKKVDPNVMGPGDFFYERNAGKNYEYKLIGFGADGQIFEKSFLD